ncbi:hypothetical protein BRADI_5g25278v3 [Brachypodium distachyon]|uniref:Uncharacterized protein n=1 Tax=Brachypodium distachyon TaxID=15368 RepID=A0A2K2CJ79_BRADI|nr:hypothetical protein BRADI_5g25278v3 [Brachypodium distachyon]
MRQRRRPLPTARPPRRRRPRPTPARPGSLTPPASRSTPPPSSVWRATRTRASASSSLTTTRNAKRKRGRLGLNETEAEHCSDEKFERQFAVELLELTASEIMACFLLRGKS